MKTKVEIIEETAAYYNLGNRAVIKDAADRLACVYNSSDGKKCAFARVCIDPIPTNYDRSIGPHGEIVGQNYTALNILDDLGESILLPEYRNHDTRFWNDIQLLHDIEGNWNEKGLSLQGFRKKQDLINKYIEAPTMGMSY